MLHIWDSVEADFMRDYGINLMEQISRMTWRRFTVLLNNLNPNGAVAMRVRAMLDDKNRETTEAEDEKAANAFFSSMLTV